VLTRTKTTSPRRWQLLLSVLCMALVFLSGTISVTHSHQNSADDHGACSLCVTAHTVAQVAAAPGQVVIVRVFESLVPTAPITRPRTFIHADHYTRPPPVRAHRA
jgi:hypothetical protein